MEKEKSNNTKEKMLKSCEKLNKLISGFIWAIAGIFITIAIIGLIFTIVLFVLPTNEAKVSAGDRYFEMTGNIEVFINGFDEKIDQIQEMKSNSTIVHFIICVVSWGILSQISSILKNTVENKTPFTPNNIRSMNIISIDSTILWIATTPFIINVGLIFILAIWIMSYIFKYGYELQLESDETL